MAVWDVPERGLSIVGEVEWSDGNYCFDTTMILKHTDGRLFIAEDAGCSCPSPFEDYLKVSDLGDPMSAQEVQAHLQERAAAEPDRSDEQDRYAFQIARVMERII